jgi:hypothetical protein
LEQKRERGKALGTQKTVSDCFHQKRGVKFSGENTKTPFLELKEISKHAKT